MIYIVLYNIHGEGIYHLYKRHPLKADLLAWFLTADAGCSSHYIIEDLKNDPYSASAMNATQYETEDGIVTITPEWVIDSEISIAKGHFFQIKTTTLIDLLEQWDRVYKQKPSPLFIVITIDNDHAVVKGMDQLPDEYKKGVE